MSSKSTSSTACFMVACWLVVVDRGSFEGMICDVLHLAASTAIEFLSSKLFAVLKILLLPLFWSVLPHYRALTLGQL